MKEFDSIQFSNEWSFIPRIGFGCWAVGGHGWGKINDADSIKAIRYAFDKGVSHFDTADCYGFGKSEKILRRALGNTINTAFVSTKGGVRWNNTGKVWNDSSPNYLRFAVEESLRRLGVDQIPLYYLHKLDSKTPITESVRELSALRKEGKIKEIGISNVTYEELAMAINIAQIKAVQIQINVLNHEKGDEIFELCKRNNVILVAWGVLADGLLTGKFDKYTSFGKNDHRSKMPFLQGELFAINLKKVKILRTIANSWDVSLAQLSLRWVMDKFECACPLFGAKTLKQVEENLGALGWRLTKKEIAYIDKIANNYY